MTLFIMVWNEQDTLHVNMDIEQTETCLCEAAFYWAVDSMILLWDWFTGRVGEKLGSGIFAHPDT